MTIDDYIIIGVNMFLLTGGIIVGLIVLEFIYLTVRNRLNNYKRNRDYERRK